MRVPLRTTFLAAALPLAILHIVAPRAGVAQEGGQGPGAAPPVVAAPSAPPQPTPAGEAGHAVYIPNHADQPVARAVRTDQRITIDGNLDEAAWMSAPAVTEFWQYDPQEGLAISEPIQVRFLYDDDAIYVGAWIKDKQIIKRLVRRDGVANDTDIFTVYFDSYHDHRTAYRFAVNAAGWRRDLIVSGGGGLGVGGITGGDTTWDPVWEVKTRIGDGEWFVEERIPFSQLRFSSAEDQVWGLQIERKIRPVQEETIWAWTPSTAAGGVGRFGHLTGIKGIKPGRPIEALPYFAGRAEYLEIPQNASVPYTNPFRSGSDMFGSVGMDVKYRMTSNLTLDATANPDFGQVEVDPAVINLSAYETRFQERRPFFVEGAEIFDFGSGGPSLVYSRRIGRAPQGSVPSASIYSSSIGATTILGAGKLTGKTASGWSLGVVDAVTARERASWLDANRVEGKYEVEPATNYFAGRVRREMRGGQTILGFLATGVNRSLGASPLESRLHSAAYSGGVDLVHQWDNRIWQFDGHLSPSWVSGSSAALINTQRTSSRYFQRPDAQNLSVDSAATSLFGYQARASVAKRAGLYRVSVDGSAISPGYEVNDLGFQSDAGRITTNVSGSIEHTRPSPRLRNWSVRLNGSLGWNYDGDRIQSDAGINASTQFLDLSRLNGRFTVRPQSMSDRLTRGGPLALSPTSWSGSASYSTDARTALSGNTSVSLGGDASGAWNRQYDVGVTWRINTRLDTSFNPGFSQSRSTAQYVTSVSDVNASQTFGRRYVFADIHQSTLSFTTRVNATLTPLLSFELYLEPFISSGRYDRLKELARPRTYDFLVYGTGASTLARTADGGYVADPDGAGPARSFALANRDFNFRSFQGNAVFRWEWRPGSTLFLVWQQVREDRLLPTAMGQDVGTFNLGRDSRELFRIHPDNIFLVKVNYWLNP